MTIDTIGTATTARSADRPVSGDAAAAQGARRAPAVPVDTAVAVQAPGAVPTQDQVNDAISKLNNASQAQANGLEFSVDQDTKRTVVKVIDQSTKEVLRQFPTEQALEIAKAFDKESSSKTTGLFIDQTA